MGLMKRISMGELDKLGQMIQIKKKLHSKVKRMKLLGKFPFGKYKGTPIIDVCCKDPKYIQWCEDNDYLFETQVYDFLEKRAEAQYA